MDNTLNHAEDVLNQGISGFHQYVLSGHVHLSYVSNNFCNMVGVQAQDLLCETDDLYANLVHPADKGRYAQFIRALCAGAKVKTEEYRLIKHDGAPIFVRDTVTTKVMADGTLVGYSVLTDLTDLKNEYGNLQFLNETMPCGFLKYTCEKQPRVTYINQQMLSFLRIPESRDGEMDYLELYKSNIFLMIPMEERRRFALYLNRVYSAGSPIAGEMAVQRCDGTRGYLFGWVTKCVNANGEEEFQSVCMDITERHQAKRDRETQRYLKALMDVYDKIFAYDLSANTVKCLYSNNSPMFRWLENVPMQMEDATEKWVSGTVAPEDCGKVRAFFRAFSQKNLYTPDAKPPQVTYHAKSSSGEMKLYSGIFLKMDDSVSLYCCRQVPDGQETDQLRIENIHLKENMQELVLRFTDGIAAFEVTADNMVIPLYASDNVCEFFGYTKEEWLPLMAKRTPLSDFVSRGETAYDEFVQLLRNGEAEFTYYDIETETEKRIKAICSQKDPSKLAPRFVMLYKVEDPASSENAKLSEDRTVSIRTFGYFDVFIGGKPIAFRNKKSKELFALLVDRRGGYITSEEAISFLWEDEPANTITLARYRKVALRLKNALEEYGVPDIMESVDGKRRIIPEKVQCDLYDYLTGKEEYAQLFKGSYLTNYSWAETTLGELSNNLE